MRISRDVELLTPVHPREPETRRPWDLVEQGTDELTLSSMPVLYGAAVEAALLWPHSYHARAIRTKMLEARIAAGEGSAAAERLIEALGGPAALKPDPEADS